MKSTSASGKGRAKKGSATVSATKPSEFGASATARLLENKVFLAAAGLVVLVLICYANTLWNGFVFDDHAHVLEYTRLRSLTNLPRLVLSYRPLRDMSYALDFAIWGERAIGFHLTNLLIHAANTVLVFILLRRLGAHLPASLIGAVIFAIHPIQTDAVSYISGRRDVLFTLFYLISFLFYLKYHRTKSVKYLAIFVLSWVLSLSSKEMAASLPLFIFTWSFCEVWDAREKSWPRRFGAAFVKALAKDRWLYLALGTMTGLYAFYQVFIKRGSERAGFGGFKYWGGGLYSNALTVLHVHAWYLKQLVVPTPITQYSGAFEVSTSIADWRVIVSIIAVVCVSVAGLAMLGKSRLAAFAVLSYFVLLLPVSQIVPHHELLADHYLYLPMMSFGLLVGIGVEKLSRPGELRRKAAYAAIGVAAVIFCVMTIKQNNVWKDDYSLWEANYAAVPNSPRAAYSFGAVNIGRNQRKAVELLKKAIELDPSYGRAYVDVAVITNNRKDASDLEGFIRQGLSLPDKKILSTNQYDDPNLFRSQLMTALAFAKSAEGDPQASESCLEQAISLYPFNPEPYDTLAQVFKGNQQKEIAILDRELSVLPSDDLALKRIATALISAKQYDDAIPYLRRILNLNSRDVFANYQMGRIYLAELDCGRARAYLTFASSNASSFDDTQASREALQQLSKQCGAQ
ncbi:MAG TPA: hypothetical protein VJX67_02875 [Blastocatellia bacterium]|nr:hypothetical protein [Blastocatellia bacterium]